MTQPEALRLADALRDSVETDGEWSQEQVVAAAAELRRLHDDYENALKHFAEVVDGYKQMAAQHDELLSALQAMLTHMGMDEDEWNKPTFDQARAAIAKAQQ